MRAVFASAVVAATLAACAPTSMTTNQVVGTPSFDRTTRTLWVDGRQSFFVPESVNTTGLRGADRVTLTWEQQGDRRVVTSYSAQRQDDRDR